MDFPNQMQATSPNIQKNDELNDEVLRSNSSGSYDQFGASHVTRVFTNQMDLNKNGLESQMLEPIKELTCETYQNNNNDAARQQSDQDMLSESKSGSNSKGQGMYSALSPSPGLNNKQNQGLQLSKQPSIHQIHQMLMSSVDGSSEHDISRKSSVDISDITRYLKIKQKRSKNTSSFLEHSKGLKPIIKESKKEKNVRSFFEQVSNQSSFVEQTQPITTFNENYKKQQSFFVADPDLDDDLLDNGEINNGQQQIQEEKPQIIKAKNPKQSGIGNFMFKPADPQAGVNSLKMLNMNKKKKNHCEICNESFKNESTFLAHIKTHVDFVCQFCGEHFRVRRTRDIHVAMKFCQEGADGQGKEFFDVTEKANNFRKQKIKEKESKESNQYKNSALSILGFKKSSGNDSKKKKENEKIMDEYILDQFLLDDI